MVGRRRVIHSLLLGAVAGGAGAMGFDARATLEREVVADKSFGVKGDGRSSDRIDLQTAIDQSVGIRVVNHHADRCRRQGVSIISGKNILFENPLWENIGGTLPEAGLDAEPNGNTDILQNIHLVNPTTRNCRTGILVYLMEIAGPVPKHIDIQITNHRDEGASDAAYSVSGLKMKGRIVSGQIVSRWPSWVGSRLGSVESYDYDKAGPRIIVTNLRLIP
jgi:hypothetical protein